MRGVLNSISIPWLIVIAIVLTVTVVVLAVWLVRHAVPATREGFHAEISAPMVGVVAALFGLILAFVIIIAFENYLDAQANVSREADSLASIVRDSDAFPHPGGANVRRAVGQYVRRVTTDEWAQMHEGNTDALAKTGPDRIYAAFRTVKPKTPEQRAFYDDAVRELSEALQARRTRIERAKGGLPRDMWILILFSSFVIIAYAVLVGSPNFWFHVLGPAAIAMVVVISLVVLADLSYPFSGEVAISSDAFKTGALHQFF
jgi:Protein of unknown function (DUF4239)